MDPEATMQQIQHMIADGEFIDADMLAEDYILSRHRGGLRCPADMLLRTVYLFEQEYYQKGKCPLRWELPAGTF